MKRICLAEILFKNFFATDRAPIYTDFKDHRCSSVPHRWQERDFGRAKRIVILLCVVLASAANASAYTSAAKHLDKPDDWYRSDQAGAIAANVRSWQGSDGGWPKNIDTAAPRPRTGEERQPPATATADGKPVEEFVDDMHARSTFDNGSTTFELRYLARMCKSTQDPRYLEAFDKGLRYVLDAQYENGGWPQYAPPGKDYSRYITFNDGAMGRVMFFVRDVAKDDLYAFVDAGKRNACKRAWDKGIDCILKCQVRVNGRLTVWCAQHDEKTFEPRPARTFEPVGLSGCETIGLVHALMAVENPTPQVIAAVDAAHQWLDSVKLPGIRVEDRPREGLPRGYERIVVEDPTAPPMWARFYEIGTNRPIFCDRDGVIKYKLSEIGHERRNGYKWLGYWPRNFLEQEYPQWKAKLDATAATRRAASSDGR